MLKIALQAAALATLVQAPAFAQEHLPDVQVRYGDLDLTDPAGIKALDRRLTRAVIAACPNDHGAVREVARLQPMFVCRAQKRAEVAALRQTAIAAAEARGAVVPARAR